MHRVGEGGMANVYYALHVALDCPVVVKVMHQHLARDADMRERFRREAESAAQLVHPHICKITDFGSVGDQVYLVMPYLARGTLADRINNRRPFPPERTCVNRRAGRLCSRLRPQARARSSGYQAGQHSVRRGRECAG